MLQKRLTDPISPATAHKVVEMRILVIEDERTLAGFIEQSLRAEGYAVTVCHDGESGEAAALTGDYALVLLDLTLPGKDGLEVLRAVRVRMPELPVIVLTARAAIEQRVEGLDRGANDYVTKPFSFEELLARVRAQLRSPSQRESSVLGGRGNSHGSAHAPRRAGRTRGAADGP